MFRLDRRRSPDDPRTWELETHAMVTRLLSGDSLFGLALPEPGGEVVRFASRWQAGRAVVLWIAERTTKRRGSPGAQPLSRPSKRWSTALCRHRPPGPTPSWPRGGHQEPAPDRRLSNRGNYGASKTAEPAIVVRIRHKNIKINYRIAK